MATSNVDLFFEANTKVLTSILQMPDDLLAIMNPLTAALMWFVLLIQWAISVFGDLKRFKQNGFLRFQFLEVFQLYGFFMFFTLFLRGFHVITFPFYPQKRFVLFYEATKKVQQEAPKNKSLHLVFPGVVGKTRMGKPNGETDPKRGLSEKESQYPHWKTSHWISQFPHGFFGC